MTLQGLLLTAITASAAALHGQTHHHHARQSTNSTTNATSYDYVVVGSGPGGGPLASRLAIAGFTVLLIEAGGDYGSNTNVSTPVFALESAEDPELKWDYFVQHYTDLERQERDTKMTYRTTDGGLHVGANPPSGAEPLGILYPRTGALGGCAEHNALITVYPTEQDWTDIQTLTGDDTWAPDNMRTYFEKLEKNEYLPDSTAGHGFDGWLHTSLTDLALVVPDAQIITLVLGALAAMGQGLLTTLLTSVTGLGNLLLNDLNSNSARRDQTQGVFQVPLAIKKDSSTRSSPHDFILDTANAVNPDGSRKYHLDVQLNTLATKIRFENSSDGTPRAVGVEYLEGSRLYAADTYYSASTQGTSGYVAAAKEVIVSAGTFNTPQLLKLSGLGPKEELESLGIDVLLDIPGLGSNMQDRYEVGVVTKASSKFEISKDCTFRYSEPDPCWEKYESGYDTLSRGPYTTSGAALAVVLKTSAVASSADPDVLVIGTPGVFAGFYPGYAYDAVIDGDRWSWLALKSHTHNNAGTVKLRSTDPREMPEIIFNYFDTGNTTGGGDESDVQALYDAVNWAREAYSKSIPLAGSFTEVIPGSNVSSEAAVKQWIKDEAWGHHACCTAAIGADGDPNAVLDSSFRVRGVDGLRVVDASVFPKIPGFFISLPIYIVSEKAADVIINGS